MTTLADLQARIRGLEARAERTDEDMTALITTTAETLQDVQWLKQAVQLLLDHHGLTMPPVENDE